MLVGWWFFCGSVFSLFRRSISREKTNLPSSFRADYVHRCIHQAFLLYEKKMMLVDPECHPMLQGVLGW